MNNIKEFFNKLKKVKNIEIIFAVLVVMIMLVIYFSSSISTGKKNKTENNTSKVTYVEKYCENVRDEILNALKSIKGAGKTELVIQWSGSVEYVYAQNSNSSSTSVSSSLQIVSGTNAPILIKIIFPKATGVVVVCEGGGKADVKVNILMAISTLLDLSTDNILVLEMKKN